jgi:hypothetical protein
MKEKKHNNLYSSHLLDIIRGYSVLESLDKTYYFKHFKVIDILELDHLEDDDIKNSIKAGIKPEKDLLVSAIKMGSWSVQEEEKLKSQEWMLKKSMSALSKIKDLAQRKVFNSQVESQEKELKEIKTKRSKITAYSAEHLAEIKKIKRMTKRAVFLNLDFTETFPEEEESEIAVFLFQKNNELNNRDSLLNCSYFGGFFDLFAAQGGNSVQLISKSFSEITSLQKNLIVLSNSLLNKVKNVSIPEELTGDPVKIMDYEEKDDESKTSHGVDDLKMKMKARGGELKAEDFLS